MKMTHKEYYQKRLDDLKKRSADLQSEMIEADAKEARGAIADALKGIADEVAEIEAQLEGIDEPKEEEEASEETEANNERMEVASMAEVRNTMTVVEERANSLKAENHMAIGAEEVRSTLISTGSIAKPQSVGGINDPFNTVSSIVDMVKIEDMTGMGSHKEAYVSAWQTAGILTDGTAPSGSDPVFKTVQITPFLLGCLSYVSREIKKQSPLQYEQKVREGALIALRKKVGEWIVNGGGTTEIFGILNAQNTDQTPASMITTINATALEEGTLRKIVFEYGGSENIGANGVLVINKKDLVAFGDIRGTDKKPVFEIIPDASNANTGIIKDGGLSVKYVISSAVTSFADASANGLTMFYGDLTNYKLGLFGNYEVNVSEDYKFGEGLLAVRGEVMVGGNVVIDKGFVALKKVASSSSSSSS